MNISQDEWRDIYIRLYAYTDYLLKSYSWFRRGMPNTFLKGKETNDYVMEAITTYLKNPEQYDSTKRELIGYLSKHIVRTLVGNDARSEENKTSIGSITFNHYSSEKGGYDQIEEALPFVQPYFGEEIDFQRIISEIRTALINDADAKALFELVSINGCLRREIIEQKGWTSEKYDSSMKRLKRIAIAVARKYNLTSKK